MSLAQNSQPHPFHRGLAAEAYRSCRESREREPVEWSDAWGGWILRRHADVEVALRDPRLSLGGGAKIIFERLGPADREALRPLERHVSLWMGTLEPPQHTCIRSLMRQAFSRELVGSMRDFAVRTAHSKIEAKLPLGRMDIVADLSHPLPAAVIANAIGAPTGDADRFTSWSRVLTEFVAHGFVRTDTLYRAQDTVLEMTKYFLRLTERRREIGGLLGRFLEMPEWRDGELRGQILANLVLLLFAGHETTSILIGNSVLALLLHPKQFDELRRDPALIPAAVQECLRFDSPIQMVRRLALTDLKFGGRDIRQGEMVWLCLGAANRDPDRFWQPDRLDLHRPETCHLAFGAGIHNCLGAALASLEAEVAVAAVIERIPDLKLSGEPLSWRDEPTARALAALPVRFSPQTN